MFQLLVTVSRPTIAVPPYFMSRSTVDCMIDLGHQYKWLHSAINVYYKVCCLLKVINIEYG